MCQNVNTFEYQHKFKMGTERVNTTLYPAIEGIMHLKLKYTCSFIKEVTTKNCANRTYIIQYCESSVVFLFHTLLNICIHARKASFFTLLIACSVVYWVLIFWLNWFHILVEMVAYLGWTGDIIFLAVGPITCSFKLQIVPHSCRNCFIVKMSFSQSTNMSPWLALMCDCLYCTDIVYSCVIQRQHWPCFFSKLNATCGWE